MKRLLLLIFVLLIPLALSLQSNSVNLQNSITIVYSEFPEILKDENTTLNLDVLNSSFAKLNSTYANCSYHVTNKNGDLLINNNLTYNESTTSWFFDLNTTYTSEKETLSYYVYCQSTSNEFGFISSTFNIVEKSSPDIIEAFFYGLSLIVLIVLLFVCVIAAFRLNGENEFEMGELKINYMKYVKITLFFLSYLLIIFIVFISYGITYNYLELSLASSVLWVIHLILWVLFPLFFFGYVTIMLVKFIMDLKIKDLDERNLPERKGAKKGW